MLHNLTHLGRYEGNVGLDLLGVRVSLRWIESGGEGRILCATEAIDPLILRGDGNQLSRRIRKDNSNR